MPEASMLGVASYEYVQSLRVVLPAVEEGK